MRGRPSKILELKSRTPELNIKLRKSVQKSVSKSIHKSIEKIKSITENRGNSKVVSKTNNILSYRPTINHELDSLKSITPEADLFSCGEGEIKIKIDDTYECKDYEDDIEDIKTTLLTNLNVKDKKINYLNIIAPKQELYNCWFNVYFMCFFISDKGRKFFRYLRDRMIRGVLADGEKMSEDIHYAFLLLNTYIEASLIGKRDPSGFANTMDTNNLIGFLGVQLIEKGYYAPGRYQRGNPINYYGSIIKYLDEKKNINMLNISHRVFKKTKIESQLASVKNMPHIFCVTQTRPRNTDIQKTFEYTIKGKTYKYSLDSAIILSSNNSHYTACITGNKKGYGFDGASFSRLVPFKWKEKINSNESWKFIDEGEEVYNFRSGFVSFFYYRI